LFEQEQLAIMRQEVEAKNKYYEEMVSIERQKLEIFKEYAKK
jgi:hypothetical protein